MTEEFVTRSEYDKRHDRLETDIAEYRKETSNELKSIHTELSALSLVVAQQGANVWKYISLSSLSFIAGILTDIALKALHIG
jgi:hypothetical protein